MPKISFGALKISFWLTAEVKIVLNCHPQCTRMFSPACKHIARCKNNSSVIGRITSALMFCIEADTRRFCGRPQNCQICGQATTAVATNVKLVLLWIMIKMQLCVLEVWFGIGRWSRIFDASKGGGSDARCDALDALNLNRAKTIISSKH